MLCEQDWYSGRSELYHICRTGIVTLLDFKVSTSTGAGALADCVASVGLILRQNGTVSYQWTGTRTVVDCFISVGLLLGQ